MISRAEWGANPLAPGGYPMGVVSEVYIHHFDSGIHAPVGAAAAARVRSGQAYHISLGWNDIGYSFLVDDDGEVFEGRGWGRTGAHTYGFNSVGYGVCWLGDSTLETPTASAIAAIAQVILDGIRLGRITANPTIVGHRDRVTDTGCPGDALELRLPEIRSLVVAPKPPIEVPDMLPAQIAQLDQVTRTVALLSEQVAGLARAVERVAGWTVDMHAGPEGRWLAVAPGTPPQPGWRLAASNAAGVFAHAVEAASAVRPDRNGTLEDRIRSAASGAAKPVTWPLREGSTGAEVVALQAKLNALLGTGLPLGGVWGQPETAAIAVLRRRGGWPGPPELDEPSYRFVLALTQLPAKNPAIPVTALPLADTEVQ